MTTTATSGSDTPSTDTPSTEALPFLLATVRLEKVTRLSPSFLRLELGGAALADLDTDGPSYDQRIKLVFPHEDGPVPSFEGADDSWSSTWLDRPVAERGHMRTYTVRRIVGEGVDTRLVVDVVVHGTAPAGSDGPDGEGLGDVGPGSSWATRARVGDEVVTIAPRRGVPYGGIEWAPGEADQVLLVGDETAVPAVAAILEQLAADPDQDVRGAAVLEVPLAADVQDLVAPPGVDVTWVVRDAAPHGERLHAAVVEHLGGGSRAVDVPDEDVDPDLWETPVWSSADGAVPALAVPVGTDLSGLYAWIAGEAKTVTGLRRVLVNELGVDRSQVAFMGYWRLGVAMRS